jgi:hypothetical protein
MMDRFRSLLSNSTCANKPWTLLNITNGSNLMNGAVELEKVDGHRAMQRIYPG